MLDPSRQPPPLCIFDDGLGRFGPLTDRRAAFSLRTGARNNRVRIECALGIMASALRVPPRLADVYRASETDARVNEPFRRDGEISFHVKRGKRWEATGVPGDADVLLVNGRWTGVGGVDASRVAGVKRGEAIVQPDGQVVAAVLGVDEAERFAQAGFDALPPGVARVTLGEPALLARPWDVLDRLEATLACDLAGCMERVAASASVHPAAVLDETRGPVVIGEQAVVGPLAVIEGPCAIGRSSVVQPHTYLRAFSVVGDYCKVAGEINASIIDDHTNKAHYGYLGNAIVGEWVNLGAGTTVSNLKNTYGEVRVQLDADTPAEPTGRQFLGPVIGDFVRTAIGTRILTGSCVGTASMLAGSGFAPKYVPAGRFITDGGDRAVDADKFFATARAMMARRKLALSPAEEAVLRGLFAASG